MHGDNHVLTMAKRCKKDRAALAKRRREIIAGVLATGNIDHAARQRLTWCCTAAECGKLCSRLVKGPGVGSVRCVDIETGRGFDLYAAIRLFDFHCPAGEY